MDIKKVQRTSSGGIKISTGSRKIQLTADRPLPTLFCDSISSSTSKCGFTDPDDTGSPPTTWLRKVRNYHLTGILFNCDGTGTGDRGVGCHQLDPPDSDCAYQVLPAAPTISTNTDYERYDPSDDCSLSSETKDFSLACHSYLYYTDAPRPCECIPENGEHFGHENECEHLCFDDYGYDEEYTTDLLISTTEEDLPDYSNNWACADEGCGACEEFFEDGQDCDCMASSNLSEDETSYSIQRFQYLFTVDEEDGAPPQGTILWWVERFQPDPDFDTPDIIPDPVDNEKSFTWNGSQMQSAIFECFEPDSNGEITIQDVSWTSGP